MHKMAKSSFFSLIVFVWPTYSIFSHLATFYCNGDWPLINRPPRRFIYLFLGYDYHII